MSVITIRVPDTLLQEIDSKAKTIHVRRAEYIRRAIQAMNKHIVDQESKRKLQNASRQVRADSMRVNVEFSEIEHDPEA